ncbi:HAD superfamily protein involved in N-acetyl-glucosamine catabolism [hydrothermal vent metagenome]|uniref:HAD superfamily protein involved in N-acetyl-glucosamine catabolism n=1 Tax=hydrothermal vent metagenome TaxID=652676 RepID=A0A3B0TB74_9ZZZZ
MTNHRIPLLPGSRALAGTYAAWLCDVWGVVHNGVAAFAGAVDALSRYRDGGGHVVLVTNAPRPAPAIKAQLEALGIPDGAYDAVVTSGDVTREMLTRIGDTPIAHIGPTRDQPLIDGMTLNFTDPDKAEIILCTGLSDDTVETPDDYADILAPCARRGATMFCANPDVVVQRGSALVYCAGALAAEYEKFGGKVVYSGKPHAPIYDLCFTRLAEIAGREVVRSEVLAVGDGMKTDILGARRAGVASLYVADGIHRQDVLGAGDAPDPARLDAMFKHENQPPVAAVFGLSW